MSIPKESIYVIAQTIGIDNLSDDVASALASDVEYRLRELTQDALKFTKHSKRHKLSTNDVNTALRLRNVEQTYGFSNDSSSSSSLSSGDSLSFQTTGRAGAGGNIFYLADEILEFNQLINQPLPKVPHDVSLACHWLAVEGVQPAIRQNPSSAEAARILDLDSTTFHSLADAAAASTASGTGATRSAAGRRNAASSSGGGGGGGGDTSIKRRKHPTTTTSTADVGLALDQSGAEQLELKPLVKHVVSQELQIYFEKIIASIKGHDREIQQVAYDSIQSDPGLQQLVPYFTQFILEEVTSNLSELALLSSLMRFTHALVSSEQLNVEPYLHQLMPAILTCVVGHHLCKHPLVEDHWSLRRFASQVLALICQRFGAAYTTLQPRITQTLLDALLDASKPLTTHYGAIVGLTALGHNVIELLLIPNVHDYYTKFLCLYLTPQQSETSTKNNEEKKSALKVKEALIDAVGRFFYEKFKKKTNLLGALQSSPASASSSSNTQAHHTKLDLSQQPVQFPNQQAIQSMLPSMSNAQAYAQLYELFGEQLAPFFASSSNQLSHLSSTFI